MQSKEPSSTYPSSHDPHSKLPWISKEREKGDRKRGNYGGEGVEEKKRVIFCYKSSADPYSITD